MTSDRDKAAQLRDRAFALILKARAGKAPENLLALLDGERRARIEALMTEASADPEAELRRLRGEELEQLERAQAQRFGPVWRELSPALRFWAWGRIQI